MTWILYYNNRGALNESHPHRLVYLNVWFPVGRTVWEGFEGMALFEMCVTGVSSDVSKAHDIPVSSVSLPPRCCLMPVPVSLLPAMTVMEFCPSVGSYCCDEPPGPKQRGRKGLIWLTTSIALFIIRKKQSGQKHK